MTELKDNVVCMGIDIGTMTIQCARSDQDDVKILRNVFLPLKEEDIDISELSEISYVKSGDGNLYIIGSDAFKFANIFGQPVCRPMQNGLISPKEIASIDILTIMLKNLIGDLNGKDAYCSYSIPAEAIDESRSVLYHEKVFSKILSSLNINFKAVNEAMAVIYSECEKEKFTGIGISWGAGMANVACAYRGVEAVKFSTARSGDWVDSNVAESLNMISNRVTSIKEKNFTLTDSYLTEQNKKTKRVLEALQFYYENLINYTIKQMVTEFEENLNIEIDEPMCIVISGGTSLPDGFLNLFKSILNKYELPFEISEIRRAKNPLTAVASGLLIKTISDVKSII